MKNNRWLIILLIVLILALVSIICSMKYDEKKEEELKNRKCFLEIDKNFYLQNGKMFIIDKNNNSVQIPGDYSQMDTTDYEKENHQLNISKGNIYTYYNIDQKIYLVRSTNTNLTDWKITELTSDAIGIPHNSEIKYIRIYGTYGYIFYINSEGIGKLLKSSTEGNYWNEVKTDIQLNDNCELKFLNNYGMTVDGFLIVPDEEDEKCDLYKINDTGESTLKKIDLSGLTEYSEELDYYSMPTYLSDTGIELVLYVGKNKEDTEPHRFISTDDGNTWITEDDYQKQLVDEKEKNDENILKFNTMVENLDSNIYLIDFDNYNVSSNQIKITENEAKEIADIGFEESAERIAKEGINDTETELIEIKEVYANNYFTRKYNEGNEVYTNIKRNVYVITKENSVGNGVMVYVDVTTGLIIGASAFGD